MIQRASDPRNVLLVPFLAGLLASFGGPLPTASAPDPGAPPAQQGEDDDEGGMEIQGEDRVDEEAERGQVFEDVTETGTVQVREVSLGKIAEGYFDGSAVVSADGKSVAWACLRGEDSAVYLNGEPVGGPFKLLGTTGISISPDGKRVAYTISRGNNDVVVRVDDQELARGYQGVSSNGMTFSADGKHFGFVAARDDKQFATIDGVEGPGFDGISSEGIVFSPDGSRVGHAGTRDEAWWVVVDGKEHGPFEKLGEQGLLFSADGKHVAWAARRDGEWLVVLDGEPGPSYKSVGQLVFSKVGGHFAYNAEVDKNQWVIVADGKPSEPTEQVSSRPTFSPDGKHLAYTTSRESEIHVVLDGEEGPAYDRLGKKAKRLLIFSDDSQHLAYVGKREKERDLVVDGKVVATVPGVFQRTIRFVPGSTDLAYVSSRGQSTFFSYRGELSQPWPRLIQDTDVLSTDGSRYAYAVRDGRQQFYVVDGQEGDRYAYIYPGLFDFTADGKDFVYIARRGAAITPVVHRSGRGPAYELVPKNATLVRGDDGGLRFVAARAGEFFLVEVLPSEGG